MVAEARVLGSDIQRLVVGPLDARVEPLPAGKLPGGDDGMSYRIDFIRPQQSLLPVGTAIMRGQHPSRRSRNRDVFLSICTGVIWIWSRWAYADAVRYVAEAARWREPRGGSRIGSDERRALWVDYKVGDVADVGPCKPAISRLEGLRAGMSG